MNKYITALLVVLAATGVEAQSYQSALKIALSDVTIEDICHQQEFKGVEQDILSIIETFKQIKKDEEREPAQTKGMFQTHLSDKSDSTITPHCITYYKHQFNLPHPSLRTCIQIRAPNRIA